MLVERPSMGIVDVSNEQRISSLAAAVLILSSLSLGECAASSGVSSSMDALALAAPPKTSIFDSPPKREQPAMTPQERLNLQKDLTAARDRHAPDAKAGAHAAPPAKPAKP
jgi:hypothetical protein